MSEYYCHAVHGDDCAALIQASPLASARTKRVAKSYAPLMRFGSVLRAGGTLVLPALTGIRDAGEGVDDVTADKRLAIALSQLSHRATDDFFKPAYRKYAPEYYDNDYSLSPSDMRIMQDIALYHARKGMPLASNDPKYDPLIFAHLVSFHEGQEPGSARHVETAFNGRVVQELLGLHTLFPADTDDQHRKLKAYIMALDPVYIDTARYADMAAQPYMNLVQRYIVELRFYDPDDPFVSLAVDIQNGAAPDPGRLAAARDTPLASLSQWGVTLSLGVSFFETAQAYMNGEIDMDSFGERNAKALEAALAVQDQHAPGKGDDE